MTHYEISKREVPSNTIQHSHRSGSHAVRSEFVLYERHSARKPHSNNVIAAPTATPERARTSRRHLSLSMLTTRPAPPPTTRPTRSVVRPIARHVHLSSLRQQPPRVLNGHLPLLEGPARERLPEDDREPGLVSEEVGRGVARFGHRPVNPREARLHVEESSQVKSSQVKSSQVKRLVPPREARLPARRRRAPS
jgi:hypothetical protein